MCASGHRQGVVGHGGSGAFFGCEVRTGWARTPPPRRRRRGRAGAPGPRGSARAGSRSRPRRRPPRRPSRTSGSRPGSRTRRCYAAASALDVELYTGTGGTGKHVPSRGFEQPKETSDEGGSMDDDAVDVTLLVGPPDGCQDEVFEALRRHASGSATGSRRRLSRRAQPRNPCASSPTRSRRSSRRRPKRRGPRGSRIGCASSRGRTSQPRRWRRR